MALMQVVDPFTSPTVDPVYMAPDQFAGFGIGVALGVLLLAYIAVMLTRR